MLLLIAINPDITYIATNAQKRWIRPVYVKWHVELYESNDDEYLCTNQQSKIRQNANNKPYELSMFNNHSIINCNINKILKPMVCTQLKHKNKWIFSTTLDIETSMVSGLKTTLITLKGTGLMEIGLNCEFKNSVMTIQGHFAVSNSIYTSQIRLKHLNAISKPPE